MARTKTGRKGAEIPPLVDCTDPACGPAAHFHRNPERVDPQYETGRRFGKVPTARMPYSVFGMFRDNTV